MPRHKPVTTPAKKLAALNLFDRRPELSTRAIAATVGMPLATCARLRAGAGYSSPYRRFGTDPGEPARRPAPPLELGEPTAWIVTDTGQVVSGHAARPRS